MKTDGSTAPTFVLELDRLTVTPLIGALAGVPVESCNCTIIAW